MPSDRRQLNVRLDPQTADLWDALVPRLEASLGVELSHGQVVALALRALAEKHPEPAPNPPSPKKRRPGTGG